jgi:hypothetical protein
LFFNLFFIIDRGERERPREWEREREGERGERREEK